MSNRVAKTVTITAAEYDYIMETIAHDGMELARLEAENARLKQLLEAKGGENNVGQQQAKGSAV
jgi:hypothetical protein